MDTPIENWLLTIPYSCPECAKRYVVVEWKKNPKCRQCGSALCADDPTDKSPLAVAAQTP